MFEEYGHAQTMGKEATANVPGNSFLCIFIYVKLQNILSVYNK